MAEKKIKDIIGTDLEDLFESVTSDFTEIIKYAVLFESEDYFYKFYLRDTKALYEQLIRYCSYFLPKLYSKKVENIFSEKNAVLPEIKEEANKTIKTVETTKTWISKTTKTDNDEETETDNDEETETDNDEETEPDNDNIKKPVEITKTAEITKTWKPAGTETDNNEETKKL